MTPNKYREATGKVRTMTVTVQTVKKACQRFTNAEDEKLETIIYKIELYLKQFSLKLLYTSL